jgi:PST family polysaccharide transporter
MMVQFGALLCGVPFGIKGIACAYVLSMFVLFIPGVVYAGRPLDIMTTDVIRAVGRQLAAALLAAGAGYLLRYLVLDGINGLVRLSVLAATYLIVYCGVVFGILGLRTPLLVIGPLLHEIVPHRIQTLLRWSIVAPCSGLNR